MADFYDRLRKNIETLNIPLETLANLATLDGIEHCKRAKLYSALNPSNLAAFAADDAAAKAVVAAIGTHTATSGSKGATEAERKLLDAKCQELRDARKSWADIEAGVLALKTEMSRWDRSEAIRRLYADAAAERGVDLTKRTPNPYRPTEY
jgi:hypothetical protein